MFEWRLTVSRCHGVRVLPLTSEGKQEGVMDWRSWSIFTEAEAHNGEERTERTNVGLHVGLHSSPPVRIIVLVLSITVT